MWSRIYLIPLLQAEEDRDLVRKHYADLAREKRLMGRETSAYNGDRYVCVFSYLRLGGRQVELSKGVLGMMLVTGVIFGKNSRGEGQRVNIGRVMSKES